MLKKLGGFCFLLCGLCILVALGYWQIERAVWKQGIIDRLDREYEKDASQYKLTPEDLTSYDTGEFKAVRGTISGYFLPEETLFWPSLLNGQYGYRLMDPLILDDGKILMVERGWSPQKLGTNIPVRLYLPPTDRRVTVTGLVRKKENNYFTPENNPISNQWRRFRAKQIADHLSVDYVFASVLFAESIDAKSDVGLADISGRLRVYPRNKHRQYAFFWFTLAGLWIVILTPPLFRKNLKKSLVI